MENLSQKIKHGIKWYFIASVVTQIIAFITGVTLARILTPKIFGIYGMTRILSTFIFMFWNLGLNAAIIQRKDIHSMR